MRKEKTNLGISARSFLVSVILLLTLISVSQVYAACSPSGMIAYWKMNEGAGTTTSDVMGANNGEISGATWVPGATGTALHFANGNYVSIDSAAGFPYGNSPRSFGFWYKTDPGASADGLILDYGSGSSHWLYLHADTANQQLILHGANGGNLAAFPTTFTATWTHAIITYDGYLTVDYYENGEYKGTFVNPEPYYQFNTQGGSAYIGGGWLDSYFLTSFPGSLDELIVTNTYTNAADALAWYNCARSVCGDGYVNASVGEQCDPPTTCTPDYGGSCPICNSSCQYQALQGAYCGDGICQAGHETYSSCHADCGSCGDGICQAEESASTCLKDCLCNGYSVTSNLVLSDNVTCSGEGFRVTANDITIDCAGHSITGSGGWQNGITVYNPNVKIKNCIVSNFGYAISLSSGASITQVTNCTLSGVSAALSVQTANNLITNNTLAGSNGILSYYGGMKNNQVYNNIINYTVYSPVYFFRGAYYNIWNNSIGGNYWAKPDGTGFSQTCADGDGNKVCDSSFILNAVGPNIDYLPLSVLPSWAKRVSPNVIQNSTGGTVEDKGITVTIPPGSLGTTELLVDIVESVHSFAPTIGVINVSPLLDIGPQCADIEDESTCGETNGCMWLPEARCDSIPFLSPVTITMPGDCSGTYGGLSDLILQKIAKYNVISGTPESVSTCDPEDMGGGIYSCQEGDGRMMTWDTNTCMISVQTYHFSTYGVAFFLDDDKDGVLNIKDDCKSDAGVKAFNGCTAALSIKAENHTKVTVGKTTTSVKLPLAGLQVEVYDMQCVKNAKLTPAAKDFDKIRAACPAVVNKTTDSAGSVFMGVNANKAYVVIGVLNGKTNSQLGTPTDTIFEGQILEKKLQYLTVPDITKMPPLSFLFDAIDQGNFLVFVITIAVALAIGYLFGRGMTKTRTITREKKRRRR
jgi:hypothetical protein